MNNIVLTASDDLRVVFDHRIDRWGHRIEIRREDQWVTAFSSIEGSSSDDWPPSPAFQHIHVQSVAVNGPTALLVGKARGSHWSAAVEADRPAGVLRFDVACRLNSEPKHLGSRYSLLDVANQPALSQLRIEVATFSDAIRRTLDLSDTDLSIRVSSESVSKSSTVRWKYVISMF
jgi:hypothetical protein